MSGSRTLRISHFRVEEQLRRDELGYFFRAVDEQLDRSVVLRVVRAGHVEGVSAPGPLRQRVRANAKAAAHVSHPNLVTIYEFRSLAETDIVVMEMVEGRQLQELRNAGRRWTVVEIARLLARVADALAAAHEAGLVHGNVNAANVRVRPDGRFKLLDLGIPKLDTIDDSVPHDPSDDVRGLARMACGLLGPPIEVHPEGTDAGHDVLADTTAARAHFGFLAPVLRKALRDSKGYANGAAFRDAVLQAMEMASGRTGAGRQIDRGFSTHVLGPAAAATVEDALPSDGRVLELMNQGGRAGGPRLVLPPDLAGRAPPEGMDSDHIRFTPRPPRWHERLGEAIGPRVAIATVILVAVAIGVAVFVQRNARAAASSATLDPPIAAADADDGASSGESATPADVPADESGMAGAPGDDSVPRATETAPVAADPPGPPVFTAAVRASPAGTTIRAVDGEGGPWTDVAEIGIAAGDTMVLEFSRNGYVPQRHEFTGSRLSVTLQPDSVIARFRANISADVFLVTGSGQTRIGTTNADVRLPTGTHRFAFRSPGQPEWATTVPMGSPGQAYTVSKQDYVTVGSLIATVSETWARVSVDGGVPRETPARFDGLSAGPHVVTVSRDGFATVIDTVIVGAGQTVRRTYDIRR